MRCKRCTTEFFLARSSAPRQFFLFGLACTLIAGMAGLAVLLSDEASMVLYAKVIGAAAAAGVVFALISMRLGARDSASMQADGSNAGGRICPSCGTLNAIRPWSR